MFQYIVSGPHTVDVRNKETEMGWEWRLFVPLSDDCKSHIDICSFLEGATNSPQAVWLTHNDVGGSLGLFPEKRQDVYLILPDPALGLKFRGGVASRSSCLIYTKTAPVCQGNQNWS